MRALKKGDSKFGTVKSLVHLISKLLTILFMVYYTVSVYALTTEILTGLLLILIVNSSRGKLFYLSDSNFILVKIRFILETCLYMFVRTKKTLPKR